ncbi:related to vacuolar transport protein ESP1 [Ustilago trichophora]|uniref:Related to vacuolar transport protein ESP1 n=1 Tax=Ustilago trichophora TaxID=86804 RepID=A0A5C3EIB1_9BASI|nr:related to vacuolar transport protein ESP1 [Ustilago trichophora]
MPPPTSTLPSPTPSPTWKARLASRWATTVRVVRRHIYFLGPGIVASVAYADPGNWATDLQAGSEYGYSLLFIVLLTGIFAVFIQILSARVGVVTNADLARQCRMLILKEDRHGSPTQRTVSHPKLRRWALLYPLYVIAEGAIVATELAELTGSAIALNLLFPALPLWAGILITSVDVILILFLYKPPPNGSFRLLEGLIAILVFTVLSCFIVLLVRIKPYWPDVFHGYLPSHHVVQSGALYVSVGILGATVMPHAIILGSHFASIDRLPSLDAAPCTTTTSTSNVDTPREEAQQDQSRWEIISGACSRLLRPKPETKAEVVRLSRVIRSLISHRTGTQDVDSESIRQSRRARFTSDDLPPRTLENIRIHLKHASVDIGMSLVSFAIVINSAILIVAAAAFYYTESGAGGSGQVVVASLYDAFYLLKERLGSLAAVLFAVALLAAGQSASITVTLAGQLVSEGFINWRTDPFLRRIVTRLVAIVPSLTVSLAVGKDGLDEMLVASQVALSIALPFVLLPLIIVTGSKARMTAEEMDGTEVESMASSTRSSIQAERTSREAAVQSPPALEDELDKGGVTHRPAFTREASTSASLALFEMLPRNHIQTDSSLRSDEPSKKPPTEQQHQQQLSQPQASSQSASSLSGGQQQVGKKSQCFASAWYVQVVAYAIFAVIVVADVYVLITTFMGID